jgi:hypothetical protein
MQWEDLRARRADGTVAAEKEFLLLLWVQAQHAVNEHGKAAGKREWTMEGARICLRTNRGSNLFALAGSNGLPNGSARTTPASV